MVLRSNAGPEKGCARAFISGNSDQKLSRNDAFPKYVEQTNHSKAVVRAMKGNIVKLMDKIRFKSPEILTRNCQGVDCVPPSS